MTKPLLRLATEVDLSAINDIYNHYVAVSTTTYDDQPISIEERRKSFEGRETIHPVTVVERDNQVVAWGALSAFRARAGYRWTVENSVYVHPECHRQGLGSLILADQIQRGGSLGLHAIVAVIDTEQAASIAIHEKYGFEEVGRILQVGRKFGRWLDAVFLQLLLRDGDSLSV